MSTHRSLPFTVRHSTGGAREILARDRARAQKLLAGIQPHGPAAFHAVEFRHRGHRSQHGHKASGGGATGGGAPTGADPSGDTIDVTDAAVTYTASVGVGNPPTSYNLLIDTGSSNTWIGADTPYTPTSTSRNTQQQVSISYGSGQMSGTEFTDQVTLSPGLVIQNQSIGVASVTQGFQGVDGILGVGPVDLTLNTVSSGDPVPTVTDNLFSQSKIQTEVLGILFTPTTSISGNAAVNGELDFGGIDPGKITGDVNYVPITSTQPAGSYWGIDQTVTYGSADGSWIMDGSGIVDTGTTLTLLATDAFQKYQRATGAQIDETTGMLTLTESQFKNLQSLFFKVGDVSYELTANAQIWPRALNTMMGGAEEKVFLIIGDLGSLSGQGLDFINGFSFLQRYYSVYDTTNSRVGLATTPFTMTETN